MPAKYSVQGMGWLPDFPDFRDRTPADPHVEPLLARATVAQPAALPASVDLSSWCSPVEDQGAIGSCTANAAVGLYEYFERRANGEYVEGSRLFVYKASRNLLHWTGDSGAFIRTAMGALVLFGVPPEEYWPYDVSQIDAEPPAFCYAFGANFKAIQYVRLDPIGTGPSDVVNQVKTYIANNFPSMFGFTVYSSIAQATAAGRIPLPALGEKVQGGHAVVAIGYDDALQITNHAAGGVTTTGAFKIRNSWGPEWGEAGYGWIPYDYVTTGLAQDWWTLVKAEWVDSPAFTSST